MKNQKEEENSMKQNVYDENLKYQELLILSYFKAHYKQYEFSEIVQMMGMTYAEMRKSIEHLLDLKYLVCMENVIIISKVGEKILEEKNLSCFFCNNIKGSIEKKQLSIIEPYIPIGFKM